MTQSDLPSRAEAIRRAVSTSGTCTQSTVEQLAILLGQGGAGNFGKAVSTARKKGSIRVQKTTAPSRPPKAKSKLVSSVTVLEDQEQQEGRLEPSAAARLATDVVNETLKALTQAVKDKTKRNDSTKTSQPPTRHETPSRNIRQSSPQPLQARSANQIPNTPRKSHLTKPEVSSTTPVHTNVAALADCSRIAFAGLRNVEVREDQTLKISAIQIETGMSALIGKLIALGLDSSAIKELKILKERLCRDKVTPGDQKSGSSSEITPLPDLLQINSIPKELRHLSLLIMSQLHVLKLLASSKKASDVDCAAHRLESSKENSLLHCIETILEETPKEEHVKYVQQLDQAASLLANLCPDPSSTQDANIVNDSCYPLPESVIRLSATSCFWHQISWQKVTKQEEIVLRSWTRLTHHIRAFVRRSKQPRRKQYVLLKEVLKPIYDSRTKRPDSPKLMAAYDSAIHEIHKTLSELASESGQVEAASDWACAWLAGLRNSDASDALVCFALCNVALARTKAWLKEPTRVDVLESLKVAASSLKGKLSGSIGEFESLLFSIASLQKALLGCIRSLKITPDEDDNIFTNVQRLSKEIIHLNTRLLYRYSQDLTNSNVRATGQKQRLDLLGRMAVSSFESILSVCRATTTFTQESWYQIDESCQLCFKLASNIEQLSTSQDLHPNESFNQAFSLISNAYWCLYQNYKDANVDMQQCKSVLRRSINILQDRPVHERSASFVHIKLERLAILHETQNDPEKAADACSRALSEILQSDFLKTVLELVDQMPLSKLIAQSEKLKIFNRILAVYARNWLRASSDTKNCTVALKFECEEPNIRGLLLELQLSALYSAVTEKTSLSTVGESFRVLVDEILQVYNDQDFPIRRLRAIVQIQKISLVVKSLQNSIAKLDVRHTDKEIAFSSDASLASFEDHLIAQYEAYLVVLDSTIDMSHLEKSLAFWNDYLSGKTSWQSVLETVGDTQGWASQLDTIAEFLNVHGMHKQRATTLFLLSRIHAMDTEFNAAIYVSKTSALAVQLTRLGFSAEAGMLFQNAQAYIGVPELPLAVSLQWHLGYTEYLDTIGNTTKCNDTASKVSSLLETLCSNSSQTSRMRDRYTQVLLESESFQLQSVLSLSAGLTPRSIYFAKRSLKSTYRAWSLLERHHGEKKSFPSSESESESATDGGFSMSLSRPQVLSNKHESLKQSNFWPLVPRLFQQLLGLSNLLSHEGLLTEAQYYAESAKRIADSLESKYLQSAVAIIQGGYDIRSGNFEAGTARLKQYTGESTYLPHQIQVILHLHLAKYHELSQEASDAVKRLKVAQVSLDAASSLDFTTNNVTDTTKGVERLSKDLSSMTLASKKSSRTKPSKPTARAKTSPTVKAGTDTVTSSSVTELPPLSNLKSEILRSSFNLAISSNDMNRAEAVLDEAKQLAMSQQRVTQYNLYKSRVLLHQGIKCLSRDPVFSLLLESTLSYPSVETSGSANVDVAPGNSSKGPKRPVASKKLKGRHATQTQDATEFLEQSFRLGLQTQVQAQSMLSIADIHTLTDVLLKSIVMLSSSSSDNITNSILAAYAMELGRSTAFLRDGLTIQTEKLLISEKGISGSTDFLSDDSLYLPSIDVRTFQKDYIDIIPPEWTVISLAISENHEDLLLSRLRSGQDPFILTIPLQRHKSGETDEESFGFDDGKSELKEIISLANFSTHDAGDMTRKGAKTEWWEARAGLDARLKDLLVNIENIWLGGFRGLFSQHVPRLELLSRFQKSFYNILDKHLPSRRKGKKLAKSGRVMLDARVLELFLGLGKPSENPEIDEPLMDLLYFVVDILQFHGERNAYDEIDFDPIILEVVDALSHYHEAASENKELDSQHTILVLDKKLHLFPWESLPCLSGQAISRLPSLTCLRDRILQQTNHSSNSPVQISADPSDGSYILNPSGDLLSTQATFTAPLSTLHTWSATVSRAPSESEITSHLSSRSIYLYFGHGSGGQYIRARSIRRLDKCAVALLLGCSSVAMTEAGEFESYGTPLNYMHAGAPAVLGTLWDVTDKDIDRFSLDVLKGWGLFEDESAKDAKGKGRARSASPVKKGKSNGKSKTKNRAETGGGGVQSVMSLDKAVAESRGSCIFRYLNGAAPVVYGVPVYLTRND